MAATKPDKIREESYDFIVKALEAQGKELIGRCKDGLVMENHLDGEHIVIKVIKKKKDVPSDEIVPITTYEEKIKAYEDNKNKQGD